MIPQPRRAVHGGAVSYSDTRQKRNREGYALPVPFGAPGMGNN